MVNDEQWHMLAFVLAQYVSEGRRWRKGLPPRESFWGEQQWLLALGYLEGLGQGLGQDSAQEHAEDFYCEFLGVKEFTLYELWDDVADVHGLK